MKRLIDYHLSEWVHDPDRKPLLLRGARQVGKTHAVRTLGKTFTHFVQLNFEEQKEAAVIFERDLDAKRIMRDLSVFTKQDIIPGSTLLFLDEIQAVPQVVTALRYFYESIPELHVIAAGSLLDFAIESVGIPVGRVWSLYMYPMSFLEFLSARGEQLIIPLILEQSLTVPLNQAIHQKTLRLLGEYIAIGGMPESVDLWCKYQNLDRCTRVHKTLVDTYRQDFERYAKTFQLEHINALFNSIPHQLGKKFNYSTIEGSYRKQELAPCLNLLCTAGITTKTMRSSGQGLPLGAQMSVDNFKVVLLDIALGQRMLGLETGAWIFDALGSFVNKGALIEALVGQELLAYSSPSTRRTLFYWQQNDKNNEAEIDYLIQIKDKIIPIEVKSGSGTSLKSMHLFLQSHLNTPFGIKCSMEPFSVYETIKSYPLYAIARLMLDDQIQKKSFDYLTK